MTKPILLTRIPTPELYMGDDTLPAFDHQESVEGEQQVEFPAGMVDDDEPTPEAPKLTPEPDNNEIDGGDGDDLDEIQKAQEEAARPKEKEGGGQTDPKKEEVADPEKDKAGGQKTDPAKAKDDEEDEDLKAIQPKRGSSPDTENGFKQLKALIKEERAGKAELKARLEALEAHPGGEEATKLKETNEQLLARLEILEAGNHPEFITAYQQKQQQASDALLNLLTEHPRLKMPKEEADKIKGMEVNSPEWVAEAKRILEATKADPLIYEEVKDSILAVRKVAQEKQEKLKTLETNRHAFYEERNKAEHAKYVQMGKDADETLAKLVEGQEWVNYKESEAGDTPEQKAAIEKHNANVKDVIVPKFKAAFQAIHDKNAKEYAKIVYKACHADEMANQIKAKEAELAKAQARIEELETKIGAARKIAAPKSQSAPITKPSVSDTVGGDADDALDAFERESRGR